MSLETRYDLLGPVADLKSDRTVPGRERFSGRPVVIHLLGGENPEANHALFALLDRLSEQDRLHIFETGTYVGVACAITDELPGQAMFRPWLKDTLAAAPAQREPRKPPTEFARFMKVADLTRPSKPSPEQAHDAEQRDVGEFTMFLKRASDPPRPDESAPPTLATPTLPPQAPPAPGEFTAFLRSAEPPAPAPPKTVESPTPTQGAPPQPPSASPAPGEFTAFLRSAEPPAPAAPERVERATETAAVPVQAAPATPSSSPPPGELTAFLNVAAAPVLPPAEPASAPVAEPTFPPVTRQADKPQEPPAPLLQADIATRVFPTPFAPKPAQPPPSAPAPRPEGEFTRFIKGAAPPSPPSQPVAAPSAHPDPPPPNPFPPAASGPGEFTQWLGGPQLGSKPARPGGLAGSTPQQSAGEYTKIMSGQPFSDLPGSGPMLAPPAAPVGSPLPQAPRGGPTPGSRGDDYDRLIGSATPQNPSPGSHPSVAPNAAAPGRNDRLIIVAVIVCVVLLLAVAVAAVLLM